MDYEVIKIRTNMNPDSDVGGVSIIESEKDISFDIKRFYFIHGVKKGISRGYHAHKALTQLLFCPYGEIKVILDNGTETAEVVLDEPDKALVVGPLLWHTMEWRSDYSILCVAASDYYDESDYIRNYDEFLGYIKDKA